MKKGESVTAAVLLVILAITAGISPLATTTATAQTATPGESATATQIANGVQLNASISATSLPVNENLTISMSLFNTLPTVSKIPRYSNWTFYGGVAVALWGTCTDYPLQVAVVKGYYSVQNVSPVAGSGLPYACYGGGGVVDYVTFLPNSDKANITGYDALGNSNGTSGLFAQSLSFSTAGYWNLTRLSQGPQPSNGPPLVGPSGTNPVPATPFSSGIYTVAVEDEWGEALTLHFEVGSAASSIASSLSSISSAGTTSPSSTSSDSASSVALSSSFTLPVLIATVVLLVVTLAAEKIGANRQAKLRGNPYPTNHSGKD